LRINEFIGNQLPGTGDKHVVNDGQQLHNTLIKVKIFQTFKQVRISDKTGKVGVITSYTRHCTMHYYSVP